MRSFNDFIESHLSDETMAKILSNAMVKGNQAALQTSGSDRSEIPGRQMIAVSFSISVELLREYHHWLEEES